MDAAVDPSPREPAAATLAGERDPVAGVLGLSGLPLSRGIERLTLKRAMPPAVLEGITGGVFSLIAYVALISLGGAAAGFDTEISTLTSFLPSAAMMFAMLYNPGGRAVKHRRYFLFAAVFGRLVFLLVPLLFLLPGAAPAFALVILFGFSVLVCAGVHPAMNQIWSANFGSAVRGRYFAYMSMASILCVGVTAWLAGWYLDADPENYRLLFPGGAIVGALALLGYYRIRLRYARAIQRGDREQDSPLKKVRAAAMRAFGILKSDRNFRLYEAGFFLYGIAFMMLLPVVPVLFSRYLKADYRDFSAATVLTTQISLFVMLPIVAKLARSRRVTLVSAISFSCLGLYPIALGLTYWTREIAFAYVAFAIFGIAMSGVIFVWNLGPITFARGGNALSHTSTHASLVGVRALIGFPLSYALMKIFPDQLLPIFAVSVAFLIGAVTVMLVLDRRMVRQGLNQTT